MTLLRNRSRLLRTLLLALVASAAYAAPAAAWQDGWSYRTKITLNPSQTGVTGEIGTTPVLVRLHAGNFQFSDAKSDGSDLRFYAGDDKTALQFQIEKWSPQEEVALVWVQVPNLSNSGPTPVYAYYGNGKAAPAGNAKAVFADRAVVWHFADQGAPQDSSGNGVTGSIGADRDHAGLIGDALKLGGQTGVGLPANFSLSGPSTVSMWVKSAAPNAAGTFFTLPGSLTIGVDAGKPYLEIGGQRAAGTVPLSGDGWTHVAAVTDGNTTTLYVNGQQAAQVAGALPAATGQANIGQGFAGSIDEFEAAHTALPVAQIQLAAASQGAGAKLFSFDKPEQVEAGGVNYLSILFSALTPDAWVVIGLLAIMCVISWIVMISKFMSISRVSAANDDFIEAYEKSSIGDDHHAGLADLPSQYAGGGSSLAHLYRVAQRELNARVMEGRKTGSRFAIRAQSIAAIRSALDATQIRETQRINKGMVLLTIAIAGGPFIGLLGTVLGVMITFAAVAAAGDVNINAIAPGIAAALLATVAGLGVAIPALFGYNYLNSRVDEVDTENRIFVDELEKRIAETWQDNEPRPSTQAAE
ncbi:MAG TPA: DUF2341 domain-containing protein [Rhizomicrobium sp.]|jgi:biopolymer transport protein ExbB